MTPRQRIGFFGVVALSVGVFLPIVHLPFVGDQDYFRNGQGDGTIVLVLALIAAFATLRHRHSLAAVSGGLSLLMVGFSYVNIQNRIDALRETMERNLAGNPFRGLGDVMLQSVQMRWGWAVLVVGSVLLISSAAVSAERPTPP